MDQCSDAQAWWELALERPSHGILAPGHTNSQRDLKGNDHSRNDRIQDGRETSYRHHLCQNCAPFASQLVSLSNCVRPRGSTY